MVLLCATAARSSSESLAQHSTLPIFNAQAAARHASPADRQSASGLLPASFAVGQQQRSSIKVATVSHSLTTLPLFLPEFLLSMQETDSPLCGTNVILTVSLVALQTADPSEENIKIGPNSKQPFSVQCKLATRSK
eukprot:scpid22701/ scgid30095/ 